MLLAPGDVVDRYRVIRELGQGGMAVVYLVEHTTLDTRHALKVLVQTSPAIRQRLIMEGRVQAKLKHPNLVAVTDVIDVDRNPGLLMEYVEGPSLRQWLSSTQPDIQTAEEKFQAIVQGVARAHEAGIIHRDLKPGNVLLDAQAGLCPKITDFGLAKALESNSPALHETRSGMAMGTPSYMAPEQIRDAKTVDGRADVFALGCILYEMVCGQQAFRGKDALEIMNGVSNGDYASPLASIPGLSRRFVATIDGCLQIDRRLRIPDCSCLLRVLSGESWSPPALDEVDLNSTFPTLDPSDQAAASGHASPAVSSGSAGSMGQVAGVNTVPSPVLRPPLPTTGDETISLADAPWASIEPTDATHIDSIAEIKLLRRRNRGLLLGVACLLVSGVVAIAMMNGPVINETAVSGEDPGLAPAAPSKVTASPEEPVLEPAFREVVAPVQTGETASTPPSEQPPRVSPPPEPEQNTAPPVPAAASGGQVTFSGADGLRLIGSNGTFGAGSVPSGTYRIEARFGARQVHAGSVQVTAGDRVSIRCDADFEMCSR